MNTRTDLPTSTQNTRPRRSRSLPTLPTTPVRFPLPPPTGGEPQRDGASS